MPEVHSQVVWVTDNVTNGARTAGGSPLQRIAAPMIVRGTWKQRRIDQQSTSSERRVGMLCGGAGKRETGWDYLAN
jgi:hypothetical protein